MLPIDEIRLNELEVLRHLKIDDCKLLKRLSISTNLRMLESLKVSNCPLMEIQILGELKSLLYFYIEECNSLERIYDLSNCKNLLSVSIRDCHRLRVVEGINELHTLEDLTAWKCGSLKELLDIQSTKINYHCSICIWMCKKLPMNGSTTLAQHKERVNCCSRNEDEVCPHSSISHIYFVLFCFPITFHMSL